MELEENNNGHRRMNDQEMIVRLHISLDDIEPEIWRRVEVPLGITLKGLHDVIQAAMPWQDYHLYQFHVDGIEYGITDPDLDPPADLKNAKNMKLETLIAKGAEELDYTYDFGDDWAHLIVIEAVEPAKPDVKYPRFIEGERQAPPEDVGGVPGYYDFIDIMGKGRGTRYRDAVEWYGEKFDPEKIDTLVIKLGVGAIAKRRLAGKMAYAKKLKKN